MGSTIQHYCCERTASSSETKIQSVKITLNEANWSSGDDTRQKSYARLSAEQHDLALGIILLGLTCTARTHSQHFPKAESVENLVLSAEPAARPSPDLQAHHNYDAWCYPQRALSRSGTREELYAINRARTHSTSSGLCPDDSWMTFSSPPHTNTLATSCGSLTRQEADVSSVQTEDAQNPFRQKSHALFRSFRHIRVQTLSP